MEQLIGLKEHSRAADIFRCTLVPVPFTETAVTQGEMKLKALRTRSRRFARLYGILMFSKLSSHGNLRGSWVCIQHFAHFDFQLAKGKRLLEQAHASIQRAVVSDHIFRVTGHVQNFHIWANLRNSLRQFAAVHAGHDHIGQQQMDDAFMRHRNLHGHSSIGGFNHFVSLSFQELPGQSAKVGLVFDHQNCFRAGFDSLRASTCRVKNGSKMWD